MKINPTPNPNQNNAPQSSVNNTDLLFGNEENNHHSPPRKQKSPPKTESLNLFEEEDYPPR